jgi:O-antigen/teichoic acid export membrane protein
LITVANLKLTNFYVRSGLFGLLSLAGAVFSYAVYPVLTHILNTREFGDFAVVVAISNQLLGILLAFNVISIYLVKSQSEEKARSHAQIIQKTLIQLFLAATLALLLASPYLNNLLKINGTGYFLVLGLILLAAVPGVIWTGYLQGHKELIRVGSFNLSASLGKLIFATLLAATFGTVGGLLGMLAGALIGLLVIRLVPGVKLPSLSSLFKASDPEEKKFLLSLKKYFLECLLVVGALGFLQNYDITLAKALFDPSQAGVYSGISVLSNALYFLCFLLIWVVLPEIKIGDRIVNRRVLGTAYKLLAALTVGALAVEVLFKGSITKLLLGNNFAGQGNLLIFATLYQLTLVAIALYAFYLLVIRQRRAALLAATCFPCAVILPAVFANTPLGMIRLLWASLLLGLGFYWLLLGLRYFQAGRSRLT